jgi:ankyrin repeat protein
VNGHIGAEQLSLFSDVTTLMDIDDRTLLDAAIDSENVDVIRYLLQFPFFVSEKDEKSAMTRAVETGNHNVVGQIVAHINKPLSKSCQSLFDLACRRGYEEIVALLLPMCSALDLDTALNCACQKGHPNVVQQLLKAGAHVPVVPQPNQPHFIDGRVFRRGDVPGVLDVLVAHGGVVNFSDVALLLCACTQGRTSLVERMLSHGTHRNVTMSRALSNACENGHIDIICRILNTQGVDLLPSMILHAFHLSLAHGEAEIADYILTARPDVAALFDYATLREAASGGCAGITRMLIAEHGLDVNHLYGGSSLIARVSDPEVVDILLQAKAEVKDAPGQSVLSAACMNLQPAAVQRLLDANAPANGSGVGPAPLLTAIRAECTDTQVQDKISVINILLDAGHRVEELDNLLGRSALHEAVVAREETNPHVAIRVFLERHPELMRSRDKTTMTPLFLAVRSEPGDVVRMLLDAGADANEEDTKGNPVIFYALEIQSLSWSEKHVARRIQDIMRILVKYGARLSECGSGGTTWLMALMSRKLPKLKVSDNATSILIDDFIDTLAKQL